MPININKKIRFVLRQSWNNIHFPSSVITKIDFSNLDLASQLLNVK